MVFGLLRLVVLGLGLLTLIYLAARLYARSLRREALEVEWDSTPANEGAAPADRARFIEAGMAAHEKGLGRRLLWLVYILPTLAFLVTVYAINGS